MCKYLCTLTQIQLHLSGTRGANIIGGLSGSKGSGSAQGSREFCSYDSVRNRREQRTRTSLQARAENDVRNVRSGLELERGGGGVSP